VEVDMPIEWRDKMSVSDPGIDQDHKTLIQLINIYEATINSGCCREVKTVFDRLVDFAYSHFEREEQIQMRVGYPYKDDHASIHHELVVGITMFTTNLCPYKKTICPADCREKVRTISKESVNEFFHHWFVDHVIKEDLKMKPFIESARALRIYSPSIEAYWKPVVIKHCYK
jgi:hemerythrin